MKINDDIINKIFDTYDSVIASGDIEGLYARLFNSTDIDTSPEIIGGLSDALYAADINILEYMDYVPVCAFYKSELPTVIIPDDITRIEDFAFARSNLERLRIPSSVTEINETAFYGCTQLELIEFEGTRDQWVKIGAVVPKITQVTFKR